MLTRKEVFYLVLLGIAAGFFMTFYPAGLLVILLFLCSVFIIKTCVKMKSSDFIIKLFIISFALRVLFCAVNYNVGLNYPFWGGDTQPDATAYNVNAFYISHLLKENTAEENFARAKDPFLDNLLERTRRYYKNEFPPVGKYQFDGHVFLLGIFYAWLGYAPIAAKMVSSLFGCISIVIVYLISRRLFEEEAPAKAAAAIFAFFPSIFYWSVTGLRDSLCNLLILAYLLCLIKAITKGGVKYIFWSCFFVYFFNLFRQKILMVLVAGIILVSILLLVKILRSRRPAAFRILKLLTVFLIPMFLFLYYPLIISKIASSANMMARVNIPGMSIEGIDHNPLTNYRIYSDLVYQQGIITLNDIFSFSYLATILKGVIYFFFAPFPLGDWSFNFLPFYPQVIYWYFMVPFVIAGWLAFLKKNTAIALNLTALLLLLIVPIALSESNIGTAFRHKDMFIPIAFVFAAYGFAKWKFVSRGA